MHGNVTEFVADFGELPNESWAKEKPVSNALIGEEVTPEVNPLVGPNTDRTAAVVRGGDY